MLEKIKNMTVEKKLRTSLTLAVIIASISGVLGAIILLSSNSSYSNALVNNGFSQGEIGIFSTYVNKEPSSVREIILVTDEAKIQEYRKELEAIQVKTDEAFATMKLHCNTKAEQEYIAVIEEALSLYRKTYTYVVELASNNQDEEALDILVTEGKPNLQKLTTAVEDLVQLNVDMGNQISQRLSIQTYIMLGLMVAMILIATFISMRLARFVAKLFSTPIIHVKDASAELAKGNLNIQIEKMYPDEIGEMTESFKEAMEMMQDYIKEISRGLGEIAEGNFDISSDVDFKGDFKALSEAIEVITAQMSETMGRIKEAAEQVSLGATQLADSAQSLAEGATDQAGSVEELTATIQNITETVINTSEKANKSYQDANDFTREAEKGNEDIKSLNQAMERISDTAKEIVNIISEIEDIASQTNLLSLNASIEAARAGEAGKGFAVVADQIGKLASDSATSAINTKRLIENTLQEIETGNAITMETTKAIEGVISGIKMLAASTKEISDLSEDQAEAMKQLEAGVEQIAEVIQNNSAAAQESSATSEELSAQSQSLEELVSQFRIKVL